MSEVRVAAEQREIPQVHGHMWARRCLRDRDDGAFGFDEAKRGILARCLRGKDEEERGEFLSDPRPEKGKTRPAQGLSGRIVGLLLKVPDGSVGLLVVSLLAEALPPPFRAGNLWIVNCRLALAT